MVAFFLHRGILRVYCTLILILRYDAFRATKLKRRRLRTASTATANEYGNEKRLYSSSFRWPVRSGESTSYTTKPTIQRHFPNLAPIRDKTQALSLSLSSHSHQHHLLPRPRPPQSRRIERTLSVFLAVCGLLFQLCFHLVTIPHTRSDIEPSFSFSDFSRL